MFFVFSRLYSVLLALLVFVQKWSRTHWRQWSFTETAQWVDTSYSSGCVDRETTVWLSKTHAKSLSGVWFTVYSRWFWGKPYDWPNRDCDQPWKQKIVRWSKELRLEDNLFITKQKTVQMPLLVISLPNYFFLNYQFKPKTPVKRLNHAAPAGMDSSSPSPLCSGATAECVFLHWCTLLLQTIILCMGWYVKGNGATSLASCQIHSIITVVCF